MDFAPRYIGKAQKFVKFCRRFEINPSIRRRIRQGEINYLMQLLSQVATIGQFYAITFWPKMKIEKNVKIYQNTLSRNYLCQKIVKGGCSAYRVVIFLFFGHNYDFFKKLVIKMVRTSQNSMLFAILELIMCFSCQIDLV